MSASPSRRAARIAEANTPIPPMAANEAVEVSP